MKHVYSGNIESLSTLVDQINEEKKVRIFPSNAIIYAKLREDKVVLTGIFCKAVGEITNENETLTLDLSIKLRRYFLLVGAFVLLFFAGFIFSDNVTINGDSDPSIWKRLAFTAIGLLMLSLGVFALSKVRRSFENRVMEKIK
jgi:hypothetical protein